MVGLIPTWTIGHHNELFLFICFEEKDIRQCKIPSVYTALRGIQREA